MSRGIRKTGIFIAVMLTVVVLTGCQIAKKDESGQAKEELYGAYAVVGDRIPDGKIAGVKDKKGFVHFKKIKGYFLYKYMPEKDTVSMDGDPQLTHFNFVSNVDGQMDDKNNITSKEKEQKVENTNNIINIELSKLVAFRKRQPFSMYDEIKKQEVLESIRENGVLVPIIVRKIENEKYEIISGHNRVECSKELNLSTIPAQIVDCDDDKATLIMIDTNLCNRDKINPIEKGYAYKIKMEILKNNPNISNINDFKDNSPMGTEDSKTQIYRYIRLTELIKSLQEKIINEDLPMRAGVELSYLSKEEQEIVNQVIEDEQIKLSLVQAQKIRANKNNITYTEVLKLLKNDRNKADKFTGKLSRKVFKEYKDKFNSDKEFSILVKKLLDDYFKSDSDI